ncbi:MAG: GNAT family N-acetyltransferase [Christensenellaceae bacterium]|nr:GNAT family N-acetyltransferase [Christensenellaceae bacterium]
MNHQGTKRLETQRLILRPFVIEDAQAMYSNWANDPEVTKYLTWPTHPSEEVSAMVTADWVKGYEKPDYYQWAIVPKELNEPIGSIAVVKPIDEKVQAAEIGYCIGRRWWHQGIMTEALARVTDYLFDEVGVRRVEARHDTRNPHSGAVMQKCGMKYEGTHRQADWNNQGVCDAAYYALLKDER